MYKSFQICVNYNQLKQSDVSKIKVALSTALSQHAILLRAFPDVNRVLGQTKTWNIVKHTSESLVKLSK